MLWLEPLCTSMCALGSWHVITTHRYSVLLRRHVHLVLVSRQEPSIAGRALARGEPAREELLVLSMETTKPVVNQTETHDN